MSRRVWKYTLAFKERQTLTMPVGATVLSAQLQGEHICVWVDVCDEFDAQQSMRFIIVGTGDEIPPDVERYVGTVQILKNVLHIYLGL
jgi:hypothetical protein